jgi:putative phosphotransacetylase
MRIPIWVSNRHIHLSLIDAEKLFGKDYVFTVLKDLSQPWQFAYQETVTIKWPKGQIDNVRILWPYRKQTQIEILLADTFKLGIKAPLRLSGDIAGTPGCEVIGPLWSLFLDHWVIVAKRHLHITVADAQHAGLHHGQVISVQVAGERGLIFDNVIVRATDSSGLDMHVDIEEWNSAWLGAGAWWEIISS